MFALNRHPILNTSIAAIMVFIICNNLVFSPSNILSWDVFGYYLYLPFGFIYGDLGLQDFYILETINKQYENTATLYQVVSLPDGGNVMKYPMGLAILYLPFFALGHFCAYVSGYATDGFSYPYQACIFAGGIVYSLIGIFVLSKVLKHFFSEVVAAVTLLLLVFGSNYIVHICMYGQNAMSQNYLFTMYALILLLSIRWHESHRWGVLIFLALVCGVTILSRPSEIVCLMIPAFWGSPIKGFLKNRLQLFRTHTKQLLVFSMVLVCVGMLQMLYWKIYTSKFLFYSYGANAGEGFEFLHPFVGEFLFSFRKGWLVYTPIMLVGIAGLFLLRKSKPELFSVLLIFFFINLYIICSWSNWWYAQSFSQRAVIPSYPLMAIGIASFLEFVIAHRKWLIPSVLFSLACVVLNIFQTIQFHKGIIHGDRMTKAYYLKTFGKLSVTDEDKKLLLINRSFDGSESFEHAEDYTCRLLKRLDFEKDGVSAPDTTSMMGMVYRLDTNRVYSPAIEVPYNEITQKDHVFLKVSVSVFVGEDVNPFSLVIHFTHKGHAYKYYTVDAEQLQLKKGQWNTISHLYLTPEVRRLSDPLKAYVWYRGKEALFIDKLQVEVFEKK
ncbi:MAG: hypothetical protein ACK5AQ_07435 [Bacteroidota bacterium]|jgi:hypothetical protein